MVELSPSASGPTSISPSGGEQAPRAVTVALAGRRLGPSLVAGPYQPGVEPVLDCPLDDQLRPEPSELRERALGLAGGDAAIGRLAVEAQIALRRPHKLVLARGRVPEPL